MSYLEFKEMPNKFGKTRLFAVINTLAQIPLGVIKFHGAWRRYLFVPDPNTMFDPDCMDEISKFAREETNKWRDSLR
jgi:hypothetical protein